MGKLTRVGAMVIIVLGLLRPMPGRAIDTCDDSANVLSNCGFESGDLRGWLRQGMASSLCDVGVYTAGGCDAQLVPDGLFSVQTGFDGCGPDRDEISQEVDIPFGGATLTFRYAATWDLRGFGATKERRFSVVIDPVGDDGPALTTVLVTAAANTAGSTNGVRLGRIDLGALGGTRQRIRFRWDIPECFTGPAAAMLDSVRLVPDVDHYQCYQAHLAAGQPRLPRTTVALANELQSHSARLGRPVAFCNPVDHDGEGVVSPATHLACYQVREDFSGDSLPFSGASATIRNEFMTETTALVRPRLLCLPSGVNGETSPPHDAYELYRLPGWNWRWRFDLKSAVRLEDAFWTSLMDVRRPTAFGVPVAVDATAVSRPHGKLACFRIRKSDAYWRNPAMGTNVLVENKVGSQVLRIGRASMLCAPTEE